MSSSEFTLLDLKNLLEWFELIPVDSKSDEKFQRTQEKIRGLFNIHEDRSKPVSENLISATLSDLESCTVEDLKSVKSMLLTKKTQLEKHIKQKEDENLVKLTVIQSEINTLQKQFAVFHAEGKDLRANTSKEISKIVSTLSEIDKKIEETTDD